jgi:SAM-dependent methyltransferase
MSRIPRRAGRDRTIVMVKSFAAFPPLPGMEEAPRWTGRGFAVGQETRRILAYGAGPSGWTDHLTELHEETAGTDHFIDLASRRHAVAEARQAHQRPETTVLEVGVSSGFLLEDLQRALPQASILGADYTRGTLEKVATRLPEVPLLQFDLVECPLPDESVDTVILLNVLEHIEHHDLALRQVHRILRPRGVAIIEVPAGEGLYDSYDKALLHWRRYSMSKLERLVRDEQFAVERRSHLGFMLYPGFWLAKKLGRATPAREEHLDRTVQRSITWSARAGALASRLLNLEASLRRRVYLPFGIRCLMTCRKASR